VDLHRYNCECLPSSLCCGGNDISLLPLHLDSNVPFLVGLGKSFSYLTSWSIYFLVIKMDVIKKKV
jgi:hypothetical protein